MFVDLISRLLRMLPFRTSPPPDLPSGHLFFWRADNVFIPFFKVAEALAGLPGADRCDRFCGWPDGEERPPPQLVRLCSITRRVSLRSATRA